MPDRMITRTDPAEIVDAWRRWAIEARERIPAPAPDELVPLTSVQTLGLLELADLVVEQADALHDLLRGARFLERHGQPQHVDTVLGIAGAVRALGKPRGWRPTCRTDEVDR